MTAIRPNAVSLAVAFVLGLVAVLGAYAPLLTEPGVILQVDLVYPLDAIDNFAGVHPIRSEPRGTVLAEPSRLPTVGLLVLVAGAMRWDSGAMFRALIIALVVVGYAGAFTLVWRAAGRTRPVAAQRALAAGAAIAGTFYILNPYVYGRLHQVFLLQQYAILPWIVLGFALALRARSARAAAGTGLVFALFGSTSPHFVVLGWLLLGLMAAAWAVPMFGHGRLESRATLRVFAVCVLFFVLGLAPQWAPVVGAAVNGVSAAPGGPAYEFTAESVLRHARFHDLLNTLTLTSQEFTHNTTQAEGLGALAWQMAALLLAALAMVGAVAGRRGRGRLTLALGAGALVAIMLNVAGTIPGLREAYSQTVVSLPFGFLFRDTEYAAGLLALSYAWGLALLVAAPPIQPAQPRNATIWSVAATLGLALAVAVIARPGLTNHIWADDGVTFRPVGLPADFRAAVDWTHSNVDSADRILVVSDFRAAPVWANGRTIGPFEYFSQRSRATWSDKGRGDDLIDRVREAGPGGVAAELGREGYRYVWVTADYPEGQEMRGLADVSSRLHPGFESDLVSVYRVTAPVAPLLEAVAADGGTAPVAVQREHATRWLATIPPGTVALRVHELYDPYFRLNTETASILPERDGIDMRFVADDLEGPIEISHVLVPWATFGQWCAGLGLVAWLVMLIAGARRQTPSAARSQALPA